MATGEKKRILVADEEPEVTRRHSIMPDVRDYAASGAHGAVQGMTRVSAVTPDRALVDFIDGLGLCTFIGRGPRTSNVPVIFFSAANSHKNIQAAMNAGATGYLQKTAGLDGVLKATNDALGAA